MSLQVLPDQAFASAAAALLVAAAALSGALLPGLARRLFPALAIPANDNDEGFAVPLRRLRQV